MPRGGGQHPKNHPVGQQARRGARLGKCPMGRECPGLEETSEFKRSGGDGKE